MRTPKSWHVFALLVACSSDSTSDVTLHPGDNVQAALIAAKTGDTITFAEGTFMFTDEQSLSVSGVTLKGAGIDKTILDFSGQASGGSGNGISVTSGSDFIMDGFSVRDTKGDSVRVQGTKNVTIRNVKVYFTAGSTTDNPGYAIYPTTVENVLIEHCEVHGASDAGIYVGQSKNIMVRNNLVSENVNGIEIENSTGAEVTNNTASNNVAGILVFNLPNLPVKTGSMTVVHDNTIMANNHAQFASDPAGIAALVPPGAGMVILAADKTEVRNNTFTGNESTGIAIAACSTLLLLGEQNQQICNDTGYDWYPQGTYIHDNTFTGNGADPQGIFTGFRTGSDPVPDILWDGTVDPNKPASDDDLFCVQNNGSATFDRAIEEPTTDLSTVTCTHPAVPGVMVTWGI